MNNPAFLPAVGSTIEVGTIRLVRPQQIKQWMIVAEAEVLQHTEGPKRDPVVGVIPIDEISTYDDFDPGHSGRSWHLRREMARALLFDSDRRFVVIDTDPVAGQVVLSLEQARLRDHAVARRDHEPAYDIYGFRSLQVLHHHLLKHPLGLSGDKNLWGEILGSKFWREGLLQRLVNVGCPAARDYDGATKVLPEQNPCAPCALPQKLKCFSVLSGLRKAYERAARACVTHASDKQCPRHYHYSTNRNGELVATVVFMDETCRKVVAKSAGGSRYTTVTLYQVDDCDVAETDARLKFSAERRRIRPLIGAAEDVKICIPPTWGY